MINQADRVVVLMAVASGWPDVKLERDRQCGRDFKGKRSSRKRYKGNKGRR